jgi:hypothetical protein
MALEQLSPRPELQSPTNSTPNSVKTRKPKPNLIPKFKCQRSSERVQDLKSSLIEDLQDNEKASKTFINTFVSKTKDDVSYRRQCFNYNSTPRGRMLEI